jgi:hypothetical protein
MRLVTIASFPTAADAFLAKNFLEENGIPASVLDEQDLVGSAPGLFVGNLAKLQVADHQAEKATEILKSAKRE